MRSSKLARFPSALFPIAAVVLTGALAYFAFLPAQSGSVWFWVLAGGPTLALAAIAVLWASREGFLGDWLVPKWGDFSRGVAGAALLFGVFWGSARWIAPVGSTREIWLVSLYTQIGNPRSLQAHALVVAAVIAIVTAAEEIVWRGMVPQLLADRIGSRTAWIWAAALYAAAYLPTMVSLGTGHGLNPVLVGAAFVGALLWGGMARAFGRLGPSILAHALFDWAAVMMFPLWGASAR